jgi:short-chain fatty acids transporter
MMREKLKEITISPFSLVIVLTFLSLLLGITMGTDPELGLLDRTITTLQFWQQGFFGLLEFTLQMMMVLVFGYCLAIVKPVHSLLKKVSYVPQNQIQAVLLTALITCFAGLINWGFGLIIGAVLARFMAISQKEKGLPSNPVLLASAGYLGMAVWHGGLSGSAPLKVAEPDHFLVNSLGVIPVSETIFSGFNIFVSGGLVIVFLVVLMLFSVLDKPKNIILKAHPLLPISPGTVRGLGSFVGLVILILCLITAFKSDSAWTVINLNFVIFLLFGLALVAYRTLDQFTEAVGSGIKSSVDIFIQFPFYAGILGIMTSSGLIQRASEFVLITTPVELIPYFTLASAALVNLLIPSGGGQWAIQGPILAETALSLNLPLGKIVMLFSYGDQISNLLQPFWALPLLSITGVSAKSLFKYCFWLFVAGITFLSLSIFLFF